MSLPSAAKDSLSLEERIEQQVLAQTCGRIHGLRVEVQAGRVVISGCTSTYYNKQLV